MHNIAGSLPLATIITAALIIITILTLLVSLLLTVGSFTTSLHAVMSRQWGPTYVFTATQSRSIGLRAFGATTIMLIGALGAQLALPLTYSWLIAVAVIIITTIVVHNFLKAACVTPVNCAENTPRASCARDCPDCIFSH